MEYNINIWLLCAVIPAIMATYLLPDNQEASKPDDIIRVLVQQVKDLQNVVTAQGHRIESLEKRLAAKERAEKLGDIGKGASNTNDLGYEGESWYDYGNHPPTTDRRKDDHSGRIVEDKANILADNSKKGELKRGIRASDNVAFSAYLDHQLVNMGIGRTVKFNQVVLNDGNHYNTHTGIFTVPVNGVYLLTFHIYDYRTSMGVALMVDDVQKSEALILPNGHAKMSGNTAILRLRAGQSVWLQTYGWEDSNLESNGKEHVVNFSGYLIY